MLLIYSTIGCMRNGPEFIFREIFMSVNNDQMIHSICVWYAMIHNVYIWYQMLDILMSCIITLTRVSVIFLYIYTINSL